MRINSRKKKKNNERTIKNYKKEKRTKTYRYTYWRTIQRSLRNYMKQKAGK